MNTKSSISFAALCACAMFADAADLHVNPTGANGAYSTIQAAVDAAQKEDRIYIAEGVYATGGETLQDSTSSRVKIEGKNLHLIGAGRGKTIIVGDLGSGDKRSGACRCIYVNYGHGTVIEGVTLKDGATICPDFSNYDSRSGGGILVAGGEGSDPTDVYLVDSEIVGCKAVYGGGARRATLVRCLVDGGYAESGLATHESRLVNCIVTRSQRAGYVSDDGVLFSSTAYNCTLADNNARYAFYKTEAHGSLVAFSSSVSETGGSSAIEECVFGSSAPQGRMQFIAPAVGDWRLIDTSDAIGAAGISRLEELSRGFPEGIDALADFSGKPIVAKEGRIDAGALQGGVVPAAGGLYFQPDSESVRVVCDGHTNALDGATWIFPDVYPTQYVFSAISDGRALCRLARRDENGIAAASQLGFAPGLDDTFTLIPPPTRGFVATNYFEYANEGKVRWVDAENGDDDNDGSQAAPYKTLKAAVESLDFTTGASVVYVKKGRYDEGTMDAPNASTEGKVRLVVDAGDYGRIRIVAVDGPEETFIVGEPQTPEFAGSLAGCGDDAVRGVFLKGKSDVSLQGFTITGCYSRSPQYTSRKNGSAFFSTDGLTRAQITDCIISNNYAYGSIVYGGLMKRCRLEGNTSMETVFNGYGSETAPVSYNWKSGTAAFCVFANNTLSEPSDGQGLIGGGARVFNCTVVGIPYSGRVAGGKAAFAQNTIFYGGEAAYGADAMENCVVWGCSDMSGATGANKVEDPAFVSRRSGDFRVKAKSPCVGYAAAVDVRDFWKVFDGAMDGALVFAGGRAVVGAYQKTVFVKDIGFAIKLK